MKTLKPKLKTFNNKPGRSGSPAESEEDMKQKVKVKIERDGKYFYIQYGSGAEWEKVKIADLHWSVKALLNTFTSGEYEAVIEAKEYTGI